MENCAIQITLSMIIIAKSKAASSSSNKRHCAYANFLFFTCVDHFIGLIRNLKNLAIVESGI